MSISMDVHDVRLFERACRALESYNQPRGSRVRAPNFAVAVAALLAKRSGSSIWPVKISALGQGTGVSTGELQSDICDRAWRKLPQFLPASAEGPIYKPFQLSFKPESVNGTNNWRNAFDLQVGLGCDAPHTTEFMLNDGYLGEERFYCRYRDPDSGQCSSPAGLPTRERTCFNPAKRGTPPGAGTNALRCPKLLARGIEDGQPRYWLADPVPDVLAQLIGSPEARVPAYPFMVALYGGSEALSQQRQTITVDDFQSDLGLDDVQFGILFDASPVAALNAGFLSSVATTNSSTGAPRANAARRVLTGGSDVSISGRTSGPNAGIQRKEFEFGRTVGDFRNLGREAADPAQRLAALEKANRGHLLTIEATAAAFHAAGYRAEEDPSSFDLLCSNAERSYLIEVKTWSHANIREQVRKGISQLAEYEWRLKQSDARMQVRKVIMLDQKPPGYMGFYLEAFVHEFLGIATCWIEDGAIHTFPSIRLQL